MRHRITLIASATLALTLAGCASGGEDASAPAQSDATSTAPSDDTGSGDDGTTAASGEVTVTIENFAYMPEQLEVAVGTTVTWMNDDPFAHTVTSGEPGAATDLFDEELGELDSAANAGANVSYTFEEAGEVEYFCRFHPDMTATVVVTEG